MASIPSPKGEGRVRAGPRVSKDPGPARLPAEPHLARPGSGVVEPQDPNSLLGKVGRPFLIGLATRLGQMLPAICFNRQTQVTTKEVEDVAAYRLLPENLPEDAFGVGLAATQPSGNGILRVPGGCAAQCNPHPVPLPRERGRQAMFHAAKGSFPRPLWAF